ncbi:hypothetical protein GTP91_32360 [Rugamonas sp. FT82W]|uniref:Uncharacterized protein n=1 Tax=Duganella vulcania TaxID=2692166 RepID=A0A845GGA7_9BURK|nr:hypothetical protein [Duganella vulcania]MYM91857.1 hypothetical protein [Duganella vulcania]
MIATLTRPFRLLLDVARLPVASLTFDPRLHPADVLDTHRRFTRPHPKYKLFGHKQLGVALIDLRRHPTPAAYLASITGRCGAAGYAGKARRRGYTLARIDRNEHIDAIHAINTSSASRQGRPMDERYQHKPARYEALSHFRYYGVFSKDGRLAAYCNVGHYGNFAAFSQLLGYRNNDGAMHLMVTDIVVELLLELHAGHGPHYLMYDTFFGAKPGLRQFKTMLGFSPYRARYTLL